LVVLFISHLTGNGNYENTNDFVADLASRASGMVQITCERAIPAQIPFEPGCLRV
jgi:hypothetical protein